MVSPARIKTNRLLAKAFDLNDFLDPTRLAHDELQYYNDLTRSFDKIISHYINWLDSSEAKKLFYEEIQNREEYFQTIDSDLDDIIQDTSLSADRIVEKVYRKGLSYGYKDINRLPVFNDACKYGLKATQEYNFELISNVSNDLIDSIRHHIFRGIAEGQSIHEVARAITDSGLKPLKGKTLTAYQRASLIARTEIARSMTTGRLQSYANYGVGKVKILTAGDDNVCPICRKAETKIYTLEEASNLIPFHPACRCSVIAHIEHYQDIPQKPTNDNVITLFSDFHDESDTFDALPYVQLNEDKIPDIFSDKIKRGFLDFDKKIQNAKWEWCYISNLTTDKVGKILTDKKPNNINLRTNIQIGFGDELIATHNHRSHMPFNRKDFKVIFKNANVHVKYLVVHTPTDIFICELDFLASFHCHEILDEINDCYGMGLRDEGSENYNAANNIWDNYKSNKLLNKYMSFRRIKK